MTGGRSLGWLEAQHTPDDVCFYTPHPKAGDQSDLPFYRYHSRASPQSPCCSNGAQCNVILGTIVLGTTRNNKQDYYRFKKTYICVLLL